jgi:hypothetical protein
VAGGGVRGKGAGIAHGTIARVGLTIEAFHLFIHGYPRAGGIITGSIVGESIDGTTSAYLISSFRKTGVAGKSAGIGKSKRLGVSKAGKPERRSSKSERTRRNPERVSSNLERTNSKSGRISSNPERTSRNLERTSQVENLNERR